VQIKNDSFYDAENVIVKLDLEFPLSLQPGEEIEQHIGIVKAYKTVTVEYKVLIDPKAVDGDKSLTVLVGEEFPTKQSTFTVSVLSRTPKIEVIETSTSYLSPGAIESVMLKVKNIGGSIAKDISIKINPDRTVTAAGLVVEREIVSIGAITNYIDHLDQGDEANVQMTLAVNQDAELKNYSIPVTIEYYDINGTERSETAYLGIKVTADADVDAVVNSITPNAFPGGTSEIVVDMFNIGLADASYVVVELSGPGVTVAEPRQFIGTLEADDFDSFKTEISFAPTVPLGELPLTLKVIYKDDSLEEIIQEKTLTIAVLNPGQAAGAGFDPVGAVIGLISLALSIVGLYATGKWAIPKIQEFRAKKKK